MDKLVTLRKATAWGLIMYALGFIGGHFAHL